VDLERAAAELRVHYQTVYRWVRDGILPAMRIGPEYDVDAADVERLVAVRSGRDADGDGPCAPDRWVDELVKALVDGDERSARSLLLALRQSGVKPTALCDGLILPALRAVEERRAAGSTSAADRLLAVGICERLAALLAFPRRGRPRGTAIVAGPEPAGHRLPGLLATVALRDDLWRVHDLGANVPARDIVDFAGERNPHTIVLAAPKAHRPSRDLLATVEGAVAVPVVWYEPETPLTELAGRVRSVVGSWRNRG